VHGSLQDGHIPPLATMFEDVYATCRRTCTSRCARPANREGRLTMATMTMIQALRSAMDVMLERDPNVVVFGEDVGYFGGVFRCTEGLQAKYGKQRVFDAPIAEGGIVGTADRHGRLRPAPVVEVQFADYFYPASDQIVSEAARCATARRATSRRRWSSACPAAAASTAGRRTARARRRCSRMSAGCAP
jgi:hypothetical protein